MELKKERKARGSEGAVAGYVNAWSPAVYRRLTGLKNLFTFLFVLLLQQKLRFVFLLPRDTFVYTSLHFKRSPPSLFAGSYCAFFANLRHQPKNKNTSL